MKRISNRACGAGLAALSTLLIAGTPASAQEAPEQFTETVAPAAPSEEHTVFNLNLGGSGNSGNTRAFSGSGGFSLRVKRPPHQFTLDGLGTMGWARSPESDSDDVEQTAANFVGRARYDYFITEANSLFAAFAPRRDIFASIAYRLQFQAGYLRAFYQPEEGHRFWGELGGDVTLDEYTLPPGQDEDMMGPDPASAEIYSVRAFLGYTNRLSSAAEVNLGVEALVPPYNEEGPEGGYRYRINGSAELNSTLTDRFKVGVSFRALFDSAPPVSAASRLDTIAALQLVYTYDSLAAEPAALECPPCEAEPEVEAAEAAEAAPGGAAVEAGAAEEATAEEGGEPAAEIPPAPEDTAAEEKPAPAELAGQAQEEPAETGVEASEEATEAGQAAAPPSGVEDAPIEPPAAETE